MFKIFRNHHRKQLVSFIIMAAAMLTIISVNYVQAQGSIIGQGVGNYEGSYDKGDYTLNDFTRLAIRVAEIIWAISGSIALLMFVYGGVLFLISSGHSQMVTRATQTMTGALIGIAIVFGSYAIVYFIMVTVLKVPTANPFVSGWFGK
jgi:hypothetical protein